MGAEIKERIKNLRIEMEKRGMDAYLVPTSDYHESEYAGGYFQGRRFLTGFTGSAGTAVVTRDECCLWVDGRYFVQAAKELEGTGIRMMKMGREGVPTIEAYLQERVPERGILGFDGRIVNAQMGGRMQALLSPRRASLDSGGDLVGRIWKDRPALPKEPVWILDPAYAGQEAGEKLDRLKSAMREAGAGVHILTTLDDIAWLLNLRGSDIPCNPVFLSYMMITDTDAVLYIDQDKLDDTVRGYLQALHVGTAGYEDIYEAAAGLRNQAVLLETAKVNYRLCTLLDGSNTVLDRMNPTSLMKAVKNPVEVENLRRAHIKDGVAVSRFMCWMKQNIGKQSMTEISAGQYLEQLRGEQEGYLEPSFDTISAYGVHGAICHYSATEDSDLELKPEGLYLVDSGGQYYEGTTDITRTFALGPLTREQKEHFTLVAMGMLRLGEVKFLQGCRGVNLDYVVREPLWQRGLDFNHGTGHGVGYLLNVHERPAGLRWKLVPEREDSAVLEEGMVISDEPGIYIEGSHGIRIENMVVCRNAEKNEYGQFMRFEYLTYAPIDLDGIDTALMEPSDIRRLNQYHREVYEKISPFMDDKEKAWLREATREIS